MKKEKVEQVLRVMEIFDALSQSRGEYRLGQIVDWSTMSRATVDRYLVKMVGMKLIDQSTGIYAGKDCRLFKMTDDGLQLLQLLEA